VSPSPAIDSFFAAAGRGTNCPAPAAVRGSSMNLSCSAFVIAVSAIAMSPASAQQPPATHALIHLSNVSNAKATVYYRWGGGPWKRYVIEKGKAAYFNHRYDGNSQTSPPFYVRIDVDTDGVKYMEHLLSRGASPDDNSPKFGHHFRIKQLDGTDTRYIEPITKGATVKVTDKNSSKPEVQ